MRLSSVTTSSNATCRLATDSRGSGRESVKMSTHDKLLSVLSVLCSTSITIDFNGQMHTSYERCFVQLTFQSCGTSRAVQNSVKAQCGVKRSALATTARETSPALQRRESRRDARIIKMKQAGDEKERYLRGQESG